MSPRQWRGPLPGSSVERHCSRSRQRIDSEYPGVVQQKVTKSQSRRRGGPVEPRSGGGVRPRGDPSGVGGASSRPSPMGGGGSLRTVSHAWNRFPQRIHTMPGSNSHVMSSPASATSLAISASASAPPPRPKVITMRPPRRVPATPAAATSTPDWTRNAFGTIYPPFLFAQLSLGRSTRCCLSANSPLRLSWAGGHLLVPAIPTVSRSLELERAPAALSRKSPASLNRRYAVERGVDRAGRELGSTSGDEGGQVHQLGEGAH